LGILWKMERTTNMTSKEQSQKGKLQVTVPTEIKNAPKIGRPSNQGEVTPTPHVPLEDYHFAFSEFHEGYVSRYIQLADTKASWIFALVSALIVFLITSDDFEKFDLFAVENCLLVILLLLTFGMLIISAIFAFLVIAPNLRSPSGEGLVFFGSVAKHENSGAYVNKVSGLSEQEMANLRLQHCYDLSKVCSKKYNRLKVSIWLGSIGVLLLVAMVLILNMP